MTCYSPSIFLLFTSHSLFLNASTSVLFTYLPPGPGLNFSAPPAFIHRLYWLGPISVPPLEADFSLTHAGRKTVSGGYSLFIGSLSTLSCLLSVSQCTFLILVISTLDLFFLLFFPVIIGMWRLTWLPFCHK